MGQTRVDLHHLLEDLRDAYPGPLEETILTEIVANSLDSGAGRISLRAAQGDAVLVVEDDGRGMTPRELSRYHDVAASSKARGQGIGFAGVGIKLGLLLCEEVLTETRKGSRHVASLWRLASRQRAPWRWVDPRGLVGGAHGTSVCLRLRNALSPLLDPGFLEATLRRHFEPLLDASFDEALAAHYASGVEFLVNGRALEKALVEGRAGISITLPRKKKPCGRGVLARSAEPLAEELRGVAVSTLGKVIRRGWDWLGVTPVAPQNVGGLIEVPVLAESLTLNKADFLRSGPRGLFYAAVRKAIQQAVMQQLQDWGQGPDPDEAARRRAVRPLERDLETVLIGLAEDYPALTPLLERRAGGQRRLPVLTPVASGGAEPGPMPTDDLPGAASGIGGEPGAPHEMASGDAPEATEPETATSDAEGRPSELDAEAPSAAKTGKSKPGGYRLGIQLEDRSDRSGMSWLIESTVWVNTAHAAYRRAVASRSEGYHLALAVAMALAPEAVDGEGRHSFVNDFLARWGEALATDRRRRGAR